MQGLNEEQRIFETTVREFCEKRLRPLVDAAERTECFPRPEILPAMAEVGFFRIGVPEALGGGGGDSTMLGMLAEHVARICGGFAAAVAPSVLGPSLLAPLGTAGQRDAWLRPIMDGRVLPALAVTEPGAGSDLLAMRTTARLDGDTYVLNGAKTFITNGPIADVLFVAAVLSEFAARKGVARGVGINLFLVPRDTPGFHVARKLGKLGMRSSETGELVFEECRIPQEYRIGGRDVNFIRVMHVLDQNRLYVNETRTPGYATLNLTSDYTLTGKRALQIFSLNVYNAGDRLYRNHSSLIKQFAPEMGRGVRFGYTVRFF